MKKAFGSIANIFSMLGIFFGLYSFGTAYIFYFNRCVGFCDTQFRDWHEPLYYGIVYLVGGIVLHFICKRLKK